MLAAVLVDMDGLLVDSEPVWTLAEHELAARFGSVFTRTTKAAIAGTRLDVAVPLLLRSFDVEPESAVVTETADWLLARMCELFGTELRPKEGALELLAALDVEDVPTALVSSSYRVLVDAGLAAIGSPRFATTLAGDEVVNGKPHPEPYLTAAARLGVDPRHCVVLEDSLSGIASGEAAGCGVVAVPETAPVQAADRRLVVASLADVGVADLRELVAG